MLKVVVWSNGADFLPEEGKTVTVDTPEFVEAMQWLADLRPKEKFGKDLIFFGGSYDSISCPHDLTYEQVYEKVKHNMETLSRGGGYLFAGVHNIPGDVPQAHLKAMLDAYYDCRDNSQLIQK